MNHPWGADPHSALRWAFRQLDRSGVLPTLLDSVLKGDRPPGSLTRLDAFAQAAVLRKIALGTDPLHAAWLDAYYLPRPTQERRPIVLDSRYVIRAGPVDRWRELRDPAIQHVAWWLMGALGSSGPMRIRGYRELVMQYLLGKNSQRRLRQALRIYREQVKDLQQKAHDKLDDLHARALREADDRLRRHGVIEENFHC